MLTLEEMRSPKYMAIVMKWRDDGEPLDDASAVLDAYGDTLEECLADATEAIKEQEEDADDWGYLQLFKDSVRECDEFYLNRETGAWEKR